MDFQFFKKKNCLYEVLLVIDIIMSSINIKITDKKSLLPFYLFKT